MLQKTLSQELEINGIGLHSGCQSVLKFTPAPIDTGIIFVRSDLTENNRFPALYSKVVDTRNCTCLGNSSKNVVSTIEHIMSALYALEISNVIIYVNNPEVPIMDGSAQIFYQKLQQTGLVEQNALQKILRPKKTIEFKDDKGNYIKLSPADKLNIDFIIDFPAEIIGHQHFNSQITPKVFADISMARTFCEKYQVDYLRSVGLIKGGSLENSLVVDNNTVLNPEGFRTTDECVKHKVLDCIGDMYTSGYRLSAKIEAYHTGHFHNNEVLKLLLADEQNFEIVEE